MAQASEGDTVRVQYVGKLGDGTVFDASAESEPLEFTIGERHVIPGFEQAVVGMKEGEKRTIHVTPDEAYGPHHPDLVFEVERDMLPPKLEPQVGELLEFRQPDGQLVGLTVTAVSESRVTLDGNHPLAGKDLAFDIELVEIVAPEE